MLKDSNRLFVTETFKVKMSETIQVKKQERSKAKTSVTFASRRLINSANREVEFGVLKDLMDDLEKVTMSFGPLMRSLKSLYHKKRMQNIVPLMEKCY